MQLYTVTGEKYHNKQYRIQKQFYLRVEIYTVNSYNEHEIEVIIQKSFGLSSYFFQG
jgi:hypothetical protein